MVASIRNAIFLLASMGAMPQVPAAVDGFPQLVDVASEIGVTLMNICGDAVKDYIVEATGNGAGFFDYDNDGDVDLLITNGSTLERYAEGGDPMAALYRNDGGVFQDVTLEAGLTETGWGTGVCVADYDNDGHQDFYLTAFGRNRLYRNGGDGTFEAAGMAAGVEETRWSTSCTFTDYDRDGDVDLYVANYLAFDPDARPPPGTCQYAGHPVGFCGPAGRPGQADSLHRNNGNGTFTDVTEESGIDAPSYYGFGVVASDFDNDGWPDIFVANDSVRNFLFHNDQDGTFSEVALSVGVGLNGQGREQAGMGVGVGDYDSNGYFDIFVTHYSLDTNTLYENLGDLLFLDSTFTAELGQISREYLGWGTGFVDLDNDGLQDIFVANGHLYPELRDLDVGTRYLQRKEVYRNRGDGGFDEVALDLGGDLLTPKSARGAAFADYDDDGDIDVVVINMNARPSVFRNEGGNASGWISFRLEGTTSNRDAIGARVEIDAAGLTQAGEVRSGSSYLSQNDMRVHFGLGDADMIDQIRVRWPNGVLEELGPVEVNRFVTIREGAGIVASRPRASD